MAQIKPSLELYHWSKDEPHSYNHLDFTGVLKKPKIWPENGLKTVFGSFLGHFLGFFKTLSNLYGYSYEAHLLTTDRAQD